MNLEERLEEDLNDLYNEAKTESSKVIAKLSRLKNPIASTLSYKLSLFLSSVYDSIPSSASFLLSECGVLWGLSLLGGEGDSNGQAVYGILSMFLMVLEGTIVTPITAKLRTNIFAAFLAKDYDGIKELLFGAVFSGAAIMLLLLTPLVWFAESILLKLGVDMEIEKLATDILVMGCLLIPLRLLSELVKSICIPQGIEKIFMLLSLASFVLFIFTSYLFICTFGWGVHGLLYTLIFCRIFESMASMYLYKTKLPEESKGIKQPESIIVTVSICLKESLSESLSLIPTIYSLHISTLFVIGLGDKNLLVAYTAINNLTAIFLYFGEGVGKGIGIKLHEVLKYKEIYLANTLSSWYFKYICYLSIPLGLVIYYGRRYIASIYTFDEDIIELTTQMLLMYGLSTPARIGASSTSLMMNEIQSGFSINLACYLLPVLLVFIGNYIALYILNLSGTYVVLVLGIVDLFRLVILAYNIFYASNWEIIQQKLNSQIQESMTKDEKFQLQLEERSIRSRMDSRELIAI